MTASGRFWRFSIIALVSTVVIAVAMAALYRSFALDKLHDMREEQNVELALSLSNSLVNEVRGLRDIAASHSWAEMQASTEIAAYAAAIEAKVKNLQIFRVNIFAPDGLTLYSTLTERIGSKVLKNPGIEMAAAGQTVSAFVKRNDFNTFDREVEQKDMIESYVPLYSESGTVIGVFEIYSEISDFFASVDEMQTAIVVGIGGGMGVLYVLLMFVLWRMDRQLFSGLIFPRRRRPGEMESETVSRAKSDFVATISHEIRTPLNAVLGMTDLLNLTSLTRKQREYVQTVQSSGDMLISLVDNLLDFSHLESGNLELHNSEFDVMDLLERVLQIMGHSACAKDLELVGNIRHDLDLRVSADKRRLQQILVNLISNAIKFTDTGEVVVDVEAIESVNDQLWLKFTVTDSGVGIEEDAREKIFAAFASGARPASSQAYGSGLGLTISKRLLDNMGGRIDIGASDKGGTKVVIEAPVGRVRSPSADNRVGHRQGWPQRVMSMHSNHSAAESVCNLLKKWEMQCEAVFDVDAGLHQLRAAAYSAKPFDCLVLDSALTPNDRLMTVRRIRNSPEIADLPVVLLISIIHPLGVGEVSALGNLRCVNKPVLPLELRYNLLRSVQKSDAVSFESDDAVDPSLNDRELRILIAEDNPVSSGVLQTMLQTEGYGADVVEDGPSVLDALRGRRYDLLLLDCQMPGMDGDIVTREIRDHQETYGSTPIIVAVTADTTERHRAQCLEAGMDDFVPKPLRLEGLRHGLVKWTAMAAKRGEEKRQSATTELRENLLQRTGYDDESLLNEYIGLFLQDTSARLDRMKKAFVGGSLENFAREAHSLKGACLELGADRMVRYCDDLSSAIASENVDEVAVVMGKLDREFKRLRPVYETVQVTSISPS